MASPSIFVFNEAYYLAQNPDVAAAVSAGAFSSGLAHWEAYGKAEGRPASAFFDLQTYKDNNGDLNEEAGFVTDADYIRHFTTYGVNEQRVFLSPTVFNADIYAAQNPDLAAAGITDRLALEQHFIRSGIYEGRISKAGFDPVAYINANADLKALLDAGGNINGYTSANIAKAGWFHYLNFGISEGRPVPAPNPSVTLTQAATSVAEGSALTYTVHLSVPLTADTTFTFNVTGDTNGGTVDAATTADFGQVSGSVTIPAGQTSWTFTVTPTLDTTLENLEGFKVTLFNSAFVVVASKTGIITDNSANAPQNFTLTTNAESVTGGAASDTVTGVLSTDGTGTTINAGDNINLGAGTDTVNLSVTGNSATNATVTSVTYTGVENVLVANFDQNSTATQTFDMTLADSSLSKVGLSASSDNGDTTFSGLKQIVAAQMVGGADLTLVYSSGVSGTSDAQTLTLASVADGSDSTSPTFTADGIETLNIASTVAANEVKVAGSTLNKVAVSGDQKLTLTESGTGLKTVDASALTGALTFTSDNSVDFSIKGGAGNDSFTLDLDAGFTAADTVDGGAGNDTLTISTDITSALLKNVSNIEHLTLAASYDLTLTSNVTITDFTVGQSASVTFSTGYTATTTLTVGGQDTAVSNGANTTLTISGSGTNIGDATITGGTVTDTLNITADSSTVSFSNITLIDKVVIADNGDTASKAGKDIVLNLGAYSTALTIDASALDAANTSATDTTGETLTVDGSTATKVLTITGGAAADTITGGSANDVINGGDGNDSINGTAGGNDSVVGGVGNDTFNFGSALTSGDTIDGGDGTDTLIVTSISGTALANVTNVENLALSGNGSSATLTSNLSFTSIDMASADNFGQTLTLSTGYTNATTVKVDANDKVENNANVALTVSGTDADVASTTVTGGTGVDTLNITATVDSGSSVGFASRITKVDVVNLVDGGDATSGDSIRGKDIVLNLGAYGTALKIDGTALDAGVLDTDGETLLGDETLSVSGGSATEALTILSGGGKDTLTSGSGNDVIDAGAGNDVITSGSGNDSVNGGTGNDTINFASGDLNAGDTIDGGEGTDKLVISSGDINDTAVFSNVKNVETLVLGSTGTQAVALSTNAGSFTTVDISATGDQTLTLNIGYTTDVNVIMTGDNATNTDKIVNAAGVALTVTANADDIDATTTITGGAGTDTIKLKANGNAADFENVTGVEVVTIVDNGDATGSAGKDITLDLGSYSTALTIDASALDAAVSTATDSTAENLTVNGGSATKALTVIGGAGDDDISSGSGNDVITGGEGNDTVDSGSGNDSIDGGAGADSIESGTGNDTILGGAGNDTINGGQGADVLTGGANADTFVYKNLNESFGSTIDTITDFTSGTDKLNITDASNATRSVVFAGNVAGLAAAQLAITATTGTDYLLSVYDTTAQKLYVDWDQNGVINNSDLVISLTGVTSLVAADVVSTNGAIIGTTIADDLRGTTGNDVFFSLGGQDTVTGGDGNDLLVLTSGANTISFASLETILGTSSNDQLTLATAGTVLVNLAAGTNTLALANGTNSITLTSATTTAVTGGTGDDAITLSAAVASGTVSFTGSTGSDSITLANGTNALTLTLTTVESVFGGTGDDTITLGSVSTSLTVSGSTGSDSLQLANGTNTISVSGIETITGGTGNDAITLTGAVTSGTVSFTGDTGDDSITLANGTNTVSLTLTTVESVFGGTGDDTITLTNAATSMTLSGSTGSDSLTLANGTNTIAISGFETVNGGTGNDTLTLAAAVTTASITVNGSTGDDTLTLANGVNSITITFSGLETINGGTGNDTITLATAGAITVADTLGTDSLTLANGTNTVTFSGFETITGGTGNDSLTFSAAVTTTTISVAGSTGDDSLTLANGTNSITISFSGLETINGGTGNDTITLGSAGTLTVAGSDGTDSLTLANGTNVISASGFETVNGGTGDDTITLTSTGSVTVAGSTGADSLTLANGVNTVSASGFETINGGTGNDAITLSAVVTTTSITVNGSTGDDSFTLANGANSITITFTGLETISGGTGDDAITLATAGTVTVAGSTGTGDILTLANGTNAVSVSGFETVAGGTGDDAITLTSAVTTTSITVNGSTGNDSFTLANGTNSITVSFSGLESINGGTGDDTITLSSSGTFTVNGSTGTDSLTLAAGGNTVSASGFESITGGTGADHITITDTSGAHTLTGSTGADTIIITGSTGADTIVFATDGNDTVTGFTSATDFLNFDAFTGSLTKAYEEVATVAGDITTDANVIVFGGTTNIAAAAAAVAADTTVTGTTGLIVIFDGTNTLVYGTDNLGADGTEVLLVTLTGITDPTTLVTADFLV